MSLESKYNLKSPGVKRLMREALELASPTEEYYACPLEDNLFEWHFTVRGPPSTEFEGGYYHGRILLPSQYPMQPPNIILLTPNGRFEVNKKICLSISGHHPESWQPSWSIRTALLALIAFMPTPAAGTIGSLDYTAEERQVLAKKSKNWECQICGKISDKVCSAEGGVSPKLTQEENSLIQSIALKAEEDANRKEVKERIEGDVIEAKSRSDTTILSDRISSSSTNIENVMHTDVLSSSAENNSSDSLWNVTIGAIVIMIVALVIRRLFFL